MKTSFGQKMRPEFTILEWRDFSGDGGALLRLPGRDDVGGGGQLQIEHQKTDPAPVKQKKKVSKPVKPTTISEDLNDSLPEDLAPPTNILKAG
jgi:hypothetical protein